MKFIRGTALAVAAAMLGLGGSAHAAYPDKPITLLVGFSAGGNLDILARTLQPFLEKELGGKIVVQNMPGANSAVMYQHLSQQKPDGYTAAINSAPSLLAPLVASDRRYAVDSFVYVATLTDEPYTLFVNHKTPRLQPFATTREFVEYAKANPGKVLISGTEIGSAPHITSLMITRATGAKFSWVPFNGSAPAVAA
ncbi:MAG: tripartite tricarboxylate transporter substrate binding protein, partial [Acetobacterales bacterium]